MTGSTHLVAGLAAAAAVSTWTGRAPGVLEVGVLLLGALAPDIDGGGAITRPGRLLRCLLGSGNARALDRLAAQPSRLIRRLCGHRGLLHTPFLCCLLAAAALFAESAWWWWFSLGYCSHLIADYFTVRGIPLFGPFWWRRSSGSGLRTGSWGEALVTVLLALLVLLQGWVYVVSWQ